MFLPIRLFNVDLEWERISPSAYSPFDTLIEAKRIDDLANTITLYSMDSQSGENPIKDGEWYLPNDKGDPIPEAQQD